jgi:hypothetical protein
LVHFALKTFWERRDPEFKWDAKVHGFMSAECGNLWVVAQMGDCPNNLLIHAREECNSCLDRRCTGFCAHANPLVAGAPGKALESRLRTFCGSSVLQEPGSILFQFGDGALALIPAFLVFMATEHPQFALFVQGFIHRAFAIFAGSFVGAVFRVEGHIILWFTS